MREHVEKRLETRFGIAARVDGNQVFDDRTIPGERVERGGGEDVIGRVRRVFCQGEDVY